jgi:hypothetical protein
LRFIEERGDAVQLMAERFFDQHMRARSDRLAGAFDVQTGRIGDQDNIWPLMLQGRIEIAYLGRVDA